MNDLAIYSDLEDKPSNLHALRKKLNDLHQEHQNQLYTIAKSKALLYKLLFGIIACLLFYLSWLSLQRSPEWIVDHYLGNAWMLKTSVAIFSLITALAALFTASQITPEKEALMRIISEKKKRLKAAYRLRLRRAGFSHFQAAWDADEKLMEMRGNYFHALEKIDQMTSESLSILKALHKESFQDRAHKEAIFNETLQELYLELTQPNKN